VANIRKNSLHQATTWLAKTKSAMVLEDLHVHGMLKNRHLTQTIADVGWYEFRRQLAYKGIWYGCQVLLADRFFLSSKQCSRCGAVKDKLNRCAHCGLVLDRDGNAAINLYQLLQTT
jgi:putative transposase